MVVSGGGSEGGQRVDGVGSHPPGGSRRVESVGRLISVRRWVSDGRPFEGRAEAAVVVAGAELGDGFPTARRHHDGRRLGPGVAAA